MNREDYARVERLELYGEWTKDEERWMKSQARMAAAEERWTDLLYIASILDGRY